MNSNGSFYARQLLHDLEIKSVPICPEQIIKNLNILFDEVDSGGKFEGCFLEENGAKCILISDDISHNKRKRFTVSHEIGHAMIPYHNRVKYECTEKDLFFNCKVDCEKEANDFAAELLMPGNYISEVIEKFEIGWDAVKNISELCDTSLTSSAIQYIKHSLDKIAFVISEERKIKHFFLSDEMVEAKLFMKSKLPLKRSSVAYDCFKSEGCVVANNVDKEEVGLYVWFPNSDDEKYVCYEHSIAIPQYNQVLSLVWVFEKDDFEDEADW